MGAFNQLDLANSRILHHHHRAFHIRHPESAPRIRAKKGVQLVHFSRFSFSHEATVAESVTSNQGRALRRIVLSQAKGKMAFLDLQL